MELNLLTAEDVAKQLRIKKYTVYELIKRGELPSSKVGKQVRISQEDIDKYLQATKTGPLSFIRKSAEISPLEIGGGYPLPDVLGGIPVLSRREGEVPEGLPEMHSAVVIISGQDLCLDLLLARIAGMGGTALRSYMGCYNGLYALYHGRVTMAASHLWDGESGDYNYPFIRRLLPGLPVGVLRLAGRMQGFYVKRGNPLEIRDWADLARPEPVMINRERGCGTRILLDQKLARLKIDMTGIKGYQREATSHLACANIVARGGADVGCGCERGAENIPGVDFIPLQLEWYDFVFRLADRNTQAVEAIVSYVTSADFKQDLEMMGGYDTSQTGIYEEF
jgi:putative molybdopterin biosynthesis protein